MSQFTCFTYNDNIFLLFHVTDIEYDYTILRKYVVLREFLIYDRLVL